MYKFYISSTYKDLEKERQAAANAVQELGHEVIAMERYPSMEERPLDKCLADVRNCDFYIGIYAYRYGYIPKGYDKSITHLEYEEAGKKSIPRLLFVIGDEAPWPKDRSDKDITGINAFKNEILEGHIVTILTDVHDLYTKVKDSILAAVKKKNKGKNIPRPGIHPILRYLSNRSVQRDELHDALIECKDTLHCKPLVCFVHGDEKECHDQFLEKAQSYILPELLNLPDKSNSINLKRFEWPTATGTTARRMKRIESDLAYQMTDKRDADANKIVQALNARKDRPIIYFNLKVANWEKGDESLIKSWLDYWNNLPDLAFGKQLFIFLCIKYKSTEGIPFLRKLKYTKRNDNARRFITQLDFNVYKKLHAVTLPELCVVPHDEMEEWIMKYAPKHCDPEALKEEIDKYFTAHKMHGIPMSDLAKQLKVFLEET